MNPRHIFAHAFGLETLIAAIVFVLVWTAIFVAVVTSARKKRTDTPASKREEHSKVEILYAVAVAGVAAFVVYLSFSTTSEEAKGAAQHATRVDVTAFQWCWRFTYPGSGRTVTGTCEHGDLPTMVIPVDTPVTVQITSKDVIHSWWVPELRYKMDGFPDHTNSFTFTVPQTGRWEGRCAEFCGHGHTTMDFYLQAVPKKQYQRWLASGSSTT
jgi:cytochrome c oxidase subunit 2